MSIHYSSDVWKHAPYTGERLLCLLALADWANDEGVCFPSYEKLAERARIQRRSAVRIMAQFLKDGAVTRIPGHGRGNVNTYALQPDAWSKISTSAEPVKGDPESPFIDPVKGDPGSTEKVTLETRKGDPDDITYIENRHGTVSITPPADAGMDLKEFRSQFVSGYQEVYYAATGEPYAHKGAADEKAVQRLFKGGHTPEKAIELAAWAFDQGNEFLRGCASTIMALSANWNRLIVARSAQGKPKSNPEGNQIKEGLKCKRLI